MEILRSDFLVTNKQEVFTSEEIEMIDASVNEFKLPANHTRLKVSIMKKTGVKSWPRAIAMLFKFGVIKTLCAMLAFAGVANDISPQFDPVRLGSARVMRSRSRNEV